MAADHLTSLLSDREAFGHWLSGFTDGEGNFHLARHARVLKSGPSKGFQAFFRIGLRSDDREIVESIQSYWGCGHIYYTSKPNGKSLIQNPQIKYHVTDIASLMEIVVPHFEEFPLRAKKAADFSIWKEAVTHISRVQSKSRSGVQKGKCPRWSAADHGLLMDLKNRLHKAKAFATQGSHSGLRLGVVPTPLEFGEADSLRLFDGLLGLNEANSLD